MVLSIDVNSMHWGNGGIITFRNDSKHFLEFRSPPFVLLTKGWPLKCTPSIITLSDIFKMRYPGKKSQPLFLRFTFFRLEPRDQHVQVEFPYKVILRCCSENDFKRDFLYLSIGCSDTLPDTFLLFSIMVWA